MHLMGLPLNTTQRHAMCQVYTFSVSLNIILVKVCEGFNKRGVKGHSNDAPSHLKEADKLFIHHLIRSGWVSIKKSVT